MAGATWPAGVLFLRRPWPAAAGGRCPNAGWAGKSRARGRASASAGARGTCVCARGRQHDSREPWERCNRGNTLCFLKCSAHASCKRGSPGLGASTLGRLALQQLMRARLQGPICSWRAHAHCGRPAPAAFGSATVGESFSPLGRLCSIRRLQGVLLPHQLGGKQANQTSNKARRAKNQQTSKLT